MVVGYEMCHLNHMHGGIRTQIMKKNMDLKTKVVRRFIERWVIHNEYINEMHKLTINNEGYTTLIAFLCAI